MLARHGLRIRRINEYYVHVWGSIGRDDRRFALGIDDPLLPQIMANLAFVPDGIADNQHTYPKYSHEERSRRSVNVRARDIEIDELDEKREDSLPWTWAPAKSLEDLHWSSAPVLEIRLPKTLRVGPCKQLRASVELEASLWSATRDSFAALQPPVLFSLATNPRAKVSDITFKAFFEKGDSRSFSVSSCATVGDARGSRTV